MSEPSVFFSDLPRSTPKVLWKILFRFARVSVRESSKAYLDMMLHGTGFVCVPTNGDDPQHVPIDQVWF